jgi:DnaJ like chaperone protein
MGWWGKVIGGTFGFMLGGPLGAVLGASFGHQFDRGVSMQGGVQFAPGATERVQTAFFTATFSVMGYIAKADGQVSRDEIALAEAVMKQMGLSPELRKGARGLFSQGKQSDFPLDEILDQFRREVHRRRSLLRVFIEIQIQAAYADGVMHTEERRALEHICARLGISQADFEALESMIRAQLHHRQTAPNRGPSLEDAYAILNIDKSATDAEVKRAYRRLMSQHHPDKLVAKGLPEEMMKVATDRTHEIRKAYEAVKEARDM